MEVAFAQILLVHLVSMTAVQSQITKGPINALKKVGDTVTLECVTSSNNCDNVEWSKMEGAQTPRTVYTNGGILNGFRDGRYNVSSTGGCSLTITQLNISDSGRFSCAFTKDASEEKKSSVLVVIDVSEACRSNVMNNALIQYDGYSYWTAINVPAKSVEPSDVILTFQKKIVYETETTDDKKPLTAVKTTLTGIARKENVTERVCRASLSPITVANFDTFKATLIVCSTPQLIVSYHVEKISFSPSSGPYYKGATVRCTADGYPYPTFKWTLLKSGAVVDGDTLVINGEAGDEYTCTATNTVAGTAITLSETIRVATSCESSRVVVVVVIVIIIIFGIIIIVVIWLLGRQLGWWPLWFCFPCFLKNDDITGLCCTCWTCFSIAFCAICTCCTYFACCMDDKVRAKADGKSAAQPLTGVVYSEAAKPQTDSTYTVLVKPLSEVAVSSEASEPLINSTTTVPEKPARVSVLSPLEAAELSKG